MLFFHIIFLKHLLERFSVYYTILFIQLIPKLWNTVAKGTCKSLCNGTFRNEASTHIASVCVC